MIIHNNLESYIEFYEMLTGEKYVLGFPSNSIVESAAISKFFIFYP